MFNTPSVVYTYILVVEFTFQLHWQEFHAQLPSGAPGATQQGGLPCISPQRQVVDALLAFLAHKQGTIRQSVPVFLGDHGVGFVLGFHLPSGNAHDLFLQCAWLAPILSYYPHTNGKLY